MSENAISWYKDYSFESSIPVVVMDETIQLELDVSLSYTARVRLKPLNGRISIPSSLSEETFRETVFAAVTMAYSVCRHRMPLAELQSGRPAAEVAEEAKRRLGDSLSDSGAVIDSVKIEKQRISDEDREMLDSIVETSKLRDPKKAAEYLLRKTQEEIARRQWICPCGKNNYSRFCPECGRPAPGGQKR